MFWLNLVQDQRAHQAVARQYVGNDHEVGRSSKCLRSFGIRNLDRILKRVFLINPRRAISLERYFAAMKKFFCESSRITGRGGIMVCIIGNSTCSGITIPTVDLVKELATEHFRVKLQFLYAIRNHYMQYWLRNGKGIREEHALIFERR